LDGVERDIHGDKEEGTLNILDTSFVGLDVEEEENSEEGSEAGSEQLDVGGLGKTDQVEEVSSAKKSELIEETCLNTSLAISSLIKW